MCLCVHSITHAHNIDNARLEPRCLHAAPTTDTTHQGTAGGERTPCGPGGPGGPISPRGFLSVGVSDSMSSVLYSMSRAFSSMFIHRRPVSDALVRIWCTLNAMVRSRRSAAASAFSVLRISFASGMAWGSG